MTASKQRTESRNQPRQRGHSSHVSLVGRRFWWCGGYARVMATAEGWWLARKKGAMPFGVREDEAVESDCKHMLSASKDK